MDDPVTEHRVGVGGFAARAQAMAVSRSSKRSGVCVIIVATRSRPPGAMSGPMSTTMRRSTRSGWLPAKAMATRPPIESPTTEKCRSRSASAKAARSAAIVVTV